MATCNDIDSSLASLRASNDAKFAAMQAQIDACCAKTDNANNLAEEALNLAKQLGLLVAGLLTTVAGLVQGASAFLTAISTLNVLAGRVDELERGLSLQGSSLSDLLGRLTALKNFTEGELAGVKQCCEDSKAAADSNFQTLLTQVSTTFTRVNQGIADIINEIRGKQCPDPCTPIDYDRISRSFPNCPDPCQPIDYDRITRSFPVCPDLSIDYDRIANSLRCPDPCQPIDYDRISRSTQCPDINYTPPPINFNYIPPAINYTPPPIVFNPIISPPVCNPPPIVFNPIITPPPCIPPTINYFPPAINYTPPPIVFNPIISPTPPPNLTQIEFLLSSIDAAVNVPISGNLDAAVCGNIASQPYNGSGLLGIKNAIDSIHVVNTQSLAALCNLLDISIDGDLIVDPCPVSPSAPANPITTITDNIVQFLLDGIISEVISAVLGSFIPGPADDAIIRQIVRSFLLGRATSIISDQIGQLLPANALTPPPATQLPTAPTPINPLDPTPVMQFYDADAKLTLRYAGRGIAGLNNQLEALSEQVNLIGRSLCEPKVIQQAPKPGDCVVIALEPDNRWNFQEITSQMSVYFIPEAMVGSYNSSTSKWRRRVIQPRDGLTWQDIEPLAHTKGEEYGKLIVSGTKRWMGGYFKDQAEAVAYFTHVATLTSLPVDPPRITTSGNPNSPAEIRLVPISAVIAKLNGSQIIETICLKP